MPLNMPILKGWYSQDGWNTKLILINRSDEENRVRIKLFEGESDKLLATIILKLKPKEMRFYRLNGIKRIKNHAGVILIDSEKELVCEGALINAKEPLKVLDYRLPRVDEYEGCC